MKRLLLGVITAFFLGVILAMFQGASFSWRILGNNLRLDYIRYIMTLAAAIFWGLYSNLSRKWGGRIGSRAIPIFLIITGIVAWIILWRKSVLGEIEVTRWSFRVFLDFVGMSLPATLFSYYLWDFAMQKGRKDFVTALSLATPLFSLVVSRLRLVSNRSLTVTEIELC